MEYTIVDDFNVSEVIRRVNEQLKEGWELYGNLAVSGMPGEAQGQARYRYAQALIKRDRQEWTTS
ncbi:MAG TPA: DUF1737 domain-containing protein [Pyrinomonadaceae bacterium]|nr:DUF1737 domain-containing protein [Pyrinomonadaceae bacterium]